MKEIPLHSKQGVIGYALVDDADYEFLNQWKWRMIDGYPARCVRKNNKGKNIWMHRVIMSCPDDKVIDHINHIRHDNQRDNLRICTEQENSQNKSKVSVKTSSKYKGVHHKKGRWHAHIKTDKTHHNLGTYGTELEAAKVYNIKARELFGEFANINDIDEESISINTKEYSSIYRGVSKKYEGRWKAAFMVDGVSVNLGLYATEIEAAIAYNAKCMELCNDTSRLNIIPIEYQNVTPKRLIDKTLSKSGYRGVHKESKSTKWFAAITANGLFMRLGNYDDPKDAAKAYNEAAMKYHGDKARLDDISA